MDLLADFKANVREFFLLERAARRFEATTPMQRAFVREHLLAAKRRLRFVPRLIDANTGPVALPTARDAVVLLVRALHASRLPAAEGPPQAPVDTAAELSRWFDEDVSAPVDWRKMLPLLATEDLLAMDRLPLAEQQALLATLTKTARWLDARIESMSKRKLWIMRVGRVVVALALVVGLLIKLLSAPNLALHKQASQSSTWPTAPPASVLVDGETSGTHTPGTPDSDLAHTNMETNPWLMVDLGAVHTLKQIRVYNRADTHFNDSLPITLEISSDGATFEAVAERTKHFGSNWLDRPWVVNIVGHVRAQYVRVRGTRYLVLSEIEVFGR